MSQLRCSCSSKTGHLSSQSRISLAAAFCITCNLYRRCCAATQYTVLPKSKCRRIKALYNILAVYRSKSHLVLYNTPYLVVLLSTIKSMCLSKQRCGSSTSPKYLKLVTTSIRSPFRLKRNRFKFFSHCRLPTIINFVFLTFKLSLFWCIQKDIVCMSCCIQSRTSSRSLPK